MPKLLEMNGAEMCSAIVSIATPLKHFLEDKKFVDTFNACTKKGMSNRLQGMLIIYTDMIPLLFDDDHIKDTIGILAVIEGKSVSEMLKMPGVELMKDALEAWKEQIQPFFTQLGLAV